MTCKDCKKRTECTDHNKSDSYDKDGDSWANWCDDFDTIHKGKSVTVNGITAVQSGYNWHVMMTDENDEFVCHVSCTRELTEQELIELVTKLKNIRGERNESIEL